MPARPSFPPGGIPGRFAGFGRFPQGKIHGILFPVIHIHPGTCQHIVQVPSGKAAIAREFFHAVIYIPVNHIGVTVVDQRLDRIDNIRNMPGYPGINLHAADIQLVHHFKIGLDVTAADIAPLHALRIRRIDDLIIYIGKILNMEHVKSFMLQKTVDHIPGYKGTGVTDMGMIIGGDAADINTRFPRDHGDEFFFSAGHCIVHFDRHSALLLLPAMFCRHSLPI